MGRRYDKLNYNEVTYYSGKYYYQGRPLTPYQIKKYREFSDKHIAKPTVPKSTTELFPKNTPFYGQNKNLRSWSRNLAVTGGKNPNYMYQRPRYWRTDKDGNGIVEFRKNRNGKVQGLKYQETSGERWGINVNKKQNVSVLNGLKGQLERHLKYLVYNVTKEAENFRIAVGYRALKIFDNSFRYSKFYSRNARSWHKLSPATLAKRRSRKTGSRILVEYGDLRNSLKIHEHSPNLPLTTTVYTEEVFPSENNRQVNTFCYAGLHNEGVGTYGRTGKRYIKRQFMGHSSHLDPMTDRIMRKMTKLYLFDAVFRVKEK